MPGERSEDCIWPWNACLIICPYILQFSKHHSYFSRLPLNPIGTHFNTFVNRADPDQAARAAWSGFALFAHGKMIKYDLTLVDRNMIVYSYNYSQWVELSMDIHEGKG